MSKPIYYPPSTTKPVTASDLNMLHITNTKAALSQSPPPLAMEKQTKKQNVPLFVLGVLHDTQQPFVDALCLAGINYHL